MTFYLQRTAHSVACQHCYAQGVGAFGSAGLGRGLAAPGRASPSPRVWERHLTNSDPLKVLSPLDQHFLKRDAGRGRGAGGLGPPSATPGLGLGVRPRRLHLDFRPIVACVYRDTLADKLAQLTVVSLMRGLQPHSLRLRNPPPVYTPAAKPLPPVPGRFDSPPRLDQRTDGLSFIEKWRVSRACAAVYASPTQCGTKR